MEASPDFDLAGLRVGGQEHRQPLRRDRDRAVGLRQLARHTCGGGAEGSGDADEYDDTPHMNCLLFHLETELLLAASQCGGGDFISKTTNEAIL